MLRGENRIYCSRIFLLTPPNAYGVQGYSRKRLGRGQNQQQKQLHSWSVINGFARSIPGEQLHILADFVWALWRAVSLF